MIRCWRTAGWAWLLLGFAALPAAFLRAQDKPAPQDSMLPSDQQGPQRDQSEAAGPIHTLHVYTDLIQVPVLVLDSEQGRMKPIDPAKFFVSLDAGPAFRPKHVRQQGDDPITLGILLDVRGASEQMPKLGDAIAGMVPDLLNPRDHVTLLAMDCGLWRTLQDIPANTAVLQGAFDRALQGLRARRKEKHPAPCEKRVQLWDAMTYAVDTLGNLPGRRVLLVVSNGVDDGSRMKWNELRQLAQRNGVAIFGYRSVQGGVAVSTFSGPRGGRGGISSGASTVAAAVAEVDPFNAICQLSGGMVLRADPNYVGKRMINFISMVRERYILEFSRPRSDEPGEHSIQVTMPRGNTSAYIRPAGVSIVMRDASLDDDPSTIPRDATGAPELGKRKPLNPSKF